MININLLPKNLRRSTGPDVWKLAAGAVAAVSLLTMLGLQLTVESRLGAVNRDVAEAQSEISVLANDVRERNDLRTRRTELQATTSVAQTLEAGRTSWSADLARFVRQLPSANSPIVALNSITMRSPEGAATPNALYDGKAITKELALSGRAVSSDALVRFVNSFENAPNFGVQFQNATREEATGDYTFAVTVGMIGDRPEPALPGATPTTPTTPPPAPSGAVPTAPGAPTTADASRGTP